MVNRIHDWLKAKAESVDYHIHDKQTELITKLEAGLSSSNVDWGELNLHHLLFAVTISMSFCRRSLK